MKLAICLFSHNTIPPKIIIEASSVEEVRDKLEMAALAYLENIERITLELSTSDGSDEDELRIKFEPYIVHFDDIVVWAGAFIHTSTNFALDVSNNVKFTNFVSEYIAPVIEILPDDYVHVYPDYEEPLSWAHDVTDFVSTNVNDTMWRI